MKAWELVTDEAEIRRLDREYQVLGRHLEEALTAAKRISSDPFLSGKIKEDAELLSRVIRREAKADAVFPETDDALIEGYYPVLLILTGVENAAKEYLKRGFDGDELLYILSAIPRTIDVHERKYAKRGLNAMYFGWLVIYLRAEMFYEGPFEFQVNQLGGSAYYFLNRSSKEAMAVAAGGRVYHENGRPAKKDAEQEPGDFMPDLIETNDAYTGFPAAEFGEYVSRFP
ncbi:MAG: hypothetical protein IK088_03230, partial [Lachnospiraceae bacterium]|nr:hypothetical protein [Lachnospiraceae bacterium]